MVIKYNLFLSCINTLEASKWTLFKVRLFGKKVIAMDGTFRTVCYKYKDKLYLTSVGEL